jgi:hypothetical protein
MLNDTSLLLSADGTLPELSGEIVPSGAILLPPASITFLEIRAE